jgi:hypothetical protein
MDDEKKGEYDARAKKYGKRNYQKGYRRGYVRGEVSINEKNADKRGSNSDKKIGDAKKDER